MGASEVEDQAGGGEGVVLKLESRTGEDARASIDLENYD